MKDENGRVLVDNQHSFDENLRIQSLWDGVELMAALLTM
jgi:hypothetical protein